MTKLATTKRSRPSRTSAASSPSKKAHSKPASGKPVATGAKEAKQRVEVERPSKAEQRASSAGAPKAPDVKAQPRVLPEERADETCPDAVVKSDDLAHVFGDRVKALMQRKGMNQTDLAKKTGIDRSELNRTLNNKRGPRPDEIIWLAGALGVEPKELIEGIELSVPVQRAISQAEAMSRLLVEVQGERDDLKAKLGVTEEALTAEREARAKDRLDLEDAARKARQPLMDRVLFLETDLKKLQAVAAAKEERHAEELAAVRNEASSQLATVQMEAAAREGALREQLASLEQQRSISRFSQKIAEARATSLSEQVTRLQQSTTTLQRQAEKEGGRLVATGLLASVLGIAFGAAAASSGSDNEED